MSKKKVHYRCSECGALTLTMLGRCPTCSAWGSIVVESEPQTSVHKENASPVSIVNVPIQTKTPSNIPELDRVLGGGWTPGGVLLLGGEPGVGKSTLLLQACHNMAQNGHRVLYISGEESAGQISLRAQRIKASHEGVHLICEQELEVALQEASQYEFIVLDSVQAFRIADENGWAGSPTQVRAVTGRAIEIAKKYSIPMVLVGHITKQGQIAGPKLLEHMVDIVLHFSGDRNSVTRLLRAEKNRYGSTEEIGIFEMSTGGLLPVLDPSHLYWEKGAVSVPGVALSAIVNGSRAMIAEIQSLSCNTPFPYPKRTSRGIEVNRIQLLLAVLERHCGIASRSHDVYINVATGLTIDDPAADLAICMALASSILNSPLPTGYCYIGEIGLAGEVRPVPRTPFRLKEAALLGFTCAIVSDKDSKIESPIPLIKVSSIRNTVERILK